MVAICFRSNYANVALDFNAVFPTAVLKLSHKMGFCAIGHLLDLLVWNGILLQFSSSFVSDWILWLTSNSDDMVDRSTSEVDSMSADSSILWSRPQIGALLARNVFGVSWLSV